MASVQSLLTIQKLFVAYYQRPADPGGQLFWATQLDANGGNIDNIDDQFQSSPESLALYGPINNSTIGTVIDVAARSTGLAIRKSAAKVMLLLIRIMKRGMNRSRYRMASNQSFTFLEYCL